METLRFVTHDQYVELVNLYHLARTALASKPHSRYDRLIWASGEFSKAHPEISPTAAYKDLETNTR